MKKILHLMLGLSLLFSACEDDKDIVVVKPGLRLSPPVPITFTSDGGTKELAVITNQSEWTVASDQAWCKATANGDKVLISVSSTDARTDLPKATVTVTAGKGKNTVTAQVMVDQTAVPPVLLSEKGEANCYVIDDKGIYRFHAGFRGKGQTPVTDSFKGCRADWVWMTTQGMIEVTPEVSEDGYITFSTPENQFIQGNAVIALTRNGIILWTWHIWATDCIKTIPGNAFMNVNLGATSDEIGSAGALGLYYQWGRKDPLIGAAGTGPNDSSSFNEATAFSEGDTNKVSYTAASVVNPELAEAWNVNQSTTPFKLEELAALPTTFVGKWGSMPTYSVMVWSKEADPCPVGWHVPLYSEMNANIGSVSSDFSVYQGLIQQGNNYWPAAGYRHTYLAYESNGRLYGVGMMGIYWSASQRNDRGFAAGVGFSNNYREYNDFMITYGLPARCIQDSAKY